MTAHMVDSTSSPKILLWDVMSTLVSEPFYDAIPKFLDLSLEELRKVRDLEAFHQFERGQLSEQEYAHRFFTSDRILDVEGMKATLRSSVHFLPGVEETLTQLRAAGVPMYALSNYSIWYEAIDAATGLSKFLDWAFVSCKTGFRKPEREAYLGPQKSLGVTPKDCLFIDDRPENVAGAEAIGMPALLRTPDMDLAQALTPWGFLRS